MRRNGSGLTEKSGNKWIGRNDILLVLAFILIALAMFMVRRINQNPGTVVIITIDGEEYGEYELSADQTVPIRGDDFTSVLVIKDGQADMTEADCPDQICVKHRPVSHAGETIVCLPHKVVVHVLSSGKTGDEIDEISR